MIVAMIEHATRILGKSQGYLGLPVRDEISSCAVNGEVSSMVSAWEPTPEELIRLNAGAKIHLRLMGSSHPPVILEVGEP